MNPTFPHNVSYKYMVEWNFSSTYKYSHMNNIVFDCERMKYNNTGLYHYCLNLGHHIQSRVNTSAENVSFFIPSEAGPVFGSEKQYIFQNSLQKFFMPSLGKFDIWHATYQSSHYLPKRNKKIKVVLSIHDLNFLYENKTAASLARHLHRLQENIDRSDAIVCVSEFCRRDVLRHCIVGDKPVYVIYNGANNLKAPALSQNSYRPLKPFLFSLGVVTRKKNFHTLLPLLKNRNMELLIAGKHDDGDYVDYIKQLARKLNVFDKLRMPGAVTEQEKSWYYHNCYAFAFPSTAEGFGLPVVEAMNAGKPLFLSDKTSLPEVGSNVAFYFHDFSEQTIKDVFEQGMSDYENNKMEDVIRERGRSFSWERAAQQYLEVYRALN